MAGGIGEGLAKLIGQAEVHPAARPVFAAHCYRVSALRAKRAIFALLAVDVVLFFAVDAVTWQAGQWETQPAHQHIFTWRVALVMFSGLLLSLDSVVSEPASHQRAFAWLSVVGFPLFGAWFAIACHPLVSDVSIYVLFLIGTAVLFPMASPAKLLVYPVSLTVLLAGVNAVSVDGTATLHASINAASAGIAALVVDAVAMRTYAADFAKSRQLVDQGQQADVMLRSILPAPIIERLHNSPDSLVEHHPSVSVLFADFAGFGRLADALSPRETVGLLEDLFSEFDAAADRFGVEKIKTSGDCYVAACGVPLAMEHHQQRVAELALRIRSIAQRFRSDRDLPVHFRIGIHCGPVIAGVIGRKRFCYDLWGETINTACLLQSASALGGIHVSAAMRDALGKEYSFSARDPIRLKGRAPAQTYYLVGRAIDGDAVREAARLEAADKSKAAKKAQRRNDA